MRPKLIVQSWNPSTPKRVLLGKETFMKKKSPIVEVTVASEDGRVPVGIMNADQALELSRDVDVEVSHPDHAAGETDVFIGTEELRDHPSVLMSTGSSEAKLREKPRGLDTVASLQEHLAALEEDAPAEDDMTAQSRDGALEAERALRRLQEEVEHLKARLQVIREQAGTVVSANMKWADASAHAQLGAYPWAKLAGAMAFTFVSSRLLRRLPLGAVASAALPLAASKMRRRYDR
jgi:hypothetical protein